MSLKVLHPEPLRLYFAGVQAIIDQSLNNDQKVLQEDQEDQGDHEGLS